MAQEVRAAYYRGGSSKAVFFHEDDIPPAGTTRDNFLKRIMGTPDELQIDGMGGSRIVTSKFAIIRPSQRSDADVDYIFTQVGITEDSISYNGNCGNISAAVGPFAITENLLKVKRKGVSIAEGLAAQEVRIYNTGTQKVLISHVPIDEKSGKVVEDGDFSIAAVPGTGAPILMDYRDTVGGSREKGILPTGNVEDIFEVDGQEMKATICDVGNLCIMAMARDVGLSGRESANEINANSKAIAMCKELRGEAALLLGMCKDWKLVDEQAPFLPMVILVANTQKEGHISARLILDNRCHDSMAGTGAICLAACSRIPGSVANLVLLPGTERLHEFQISHPLGIMPVAVIENNDIHSTQSQGVSFETLAFVRTARRLMSGCVHVPSSVAFSPTPKTPEKKQKTNGISSKN